VPKDYQNKEAKKAEQEQAVYPYEPDIEKVRDTGPGCSGRNGAGRGREESPEW
jgi:hypothetical protein